MYFAPDVKLFGAIDEIFIVRADIDNSVFIEYNIYIKILPIDTAYINIT